MPEVGTQSKTFDPLRAVNGSVSPFIGHFWLQEGISGDDLFDLGIGCEALRVEEIITGNPFLQPEVAYEWTYGAVYSPKWIKGLTLSVDFWHIDLRSIAA